MSSDLVLVITGFEDDNEAWGWFHDLSEYDFRTVMVHLDNPCSVEEVLA